MARIKKEKTVPKRYALYLMVIFLIALFYRVEAGKIVGGANNYLKQSQNKQAEIVKESIERQKSSLNVYELTKLGKEFREEGNPETAADILKTAIEKDPNYRDSYLFLAMAYLDLKKADLAMSVLERSLKIDPTYGPTHYLLGQVYELKKDKKSAEAEFAKARELGFKGFGGE